MYILMYIFKFSKFNKKVHLLVNEQYIVCCRLRYSWKTESTSLCLQVKYR